MIVQSPENEGEDNAYTFVHENTHQPTQVPCPFFPITNTLAICLKDFLLNESIYISILASARKLELLLTLSQVRDSLVLCLYYNVYCSYGVTKLSSITCLLDLLPTLDMER